MVTWEPSTVTLCVGRGEGSGDEVRGPATRSRLKLRGCSCWLALGGRRRYGTRSCTDVAVSGGRSFSHCRRFARQACCDADLRWRGDFAILTLFGGGHAHVRPIRVRAAATRLLWPSAPGQSLDQPAPCGLVAGPSWFRRVQSDAIQARPAGWVLATASPSLHPPPPDRLGGDSAWSQLGPGRYRLAGPPQRRTVSWARRL
jgi:hypothetical protein